jgi:hypothetical protein
MPEFIETFKLPIFIIWLVSILFFIYIFYIKYKNKTGEDVSFLESVSLPLPMIFFSILFIITSLFLVMLFIKSGLDLITNNKYGLMIMLGICILPFFINVNKKK